MARVKPENLEFADKHINIIISGPPSTGKSTLGESAPNPILVDFDDGIARVNPAHRTDAIICNSYEEFLSDIKECEGQYETVIIDTCGALIDFMKDWAMRTDPKASKANGGFSLQGYGVIKTEYLRLSAYLRKHFNTVYIFHENLTRNGDDGVFYELVVEGSARSLCYQPADLACHLFIEHGKRYAGFTPTESYNAKSSYGIKGILEIPELKDGDKNDFLTKLFAKVRENLAAESKAVAPAKKQYDEAIAEAKEICEAVKFPDDVQLAVDALSKLNHALTSEKESKAMLKKRIAELGIIWNKSTKTYEYGKS